MNRKGSLMNMPLGFIGFFILILILVTLLPIHYGQDIDYNQTLNWNSLEVVQKFKGGSDNIIVDIVYKFVDFLGYASFEVAQAGVDFGIARPDIVNPVILLYLIFAALLSPILVAVFKIVIIIIILIKEYFQVRKEKRKMEGGINQ